MPPSFCKKRGHQNLCQSALIDRNAVPKEDHIPAKGAQFLGNLPNVHGHRRFDPLQSVFPKLIDPRINLIPPCIHQRTDQLVRAVQIISKAVQRRNGR